MRMIIIILIMWVELKDNEKAWLWKPVILMLFLMKSSIITKRFKMHKSSNFVVLHYCMCIIKNMKLQKKLQWFKYGLAHLLPAFFLLDRKLSTTVLFIIISPIGLQ